jgi:uncharacterized membrane protein
MGRHYTHVRSPYQDVEWALEEGCVTAAATILLLWAAFAASHMGLASNRLRPRLVARLGERGYSGIYSLISLATFVPLVAVYFGHKHAGPLLWNLGDVPGMRWLMYVGMGLAFALVVAGGARPSPASMVPGKAEVKGVFRITRHPVFMGIGLYGLIHLLVVPVNASELVFFGGFPVFAVAGCRHQDQRKLGTLGDDFRRVHDHRDRRGHRSPLLPRGSVRLTFCENASRTLCSGTSE